MSKNRQDKAIKSLFSLFKNLEDSAYPKKLLIERRNWFLLFIEGLTKINFFFRRKND